MSSQVPQALLSDGDGAPQDIGSSTRSIGPLITAMGSGKELNALSTIPPIGAPSDLGQLAASKVGNAPSDARGATQSPHLPPFAYRRDAACEGFDRILKTINDNVGMYPPLTNGQKSRC